MTRDSLDLELGDLARSPVAWIAGTLGTVAAVAASMPDVWGMLMATSGTWFPAAAVGLTTVVPNLEAVLEGTAPTRIKLLVVLASVYVAILLDRLVTKLQAKLKGN